MNVFNNKLQWEIIRIIANDYQTFDKYTVTLYPKELKILHIALCMLPSNADIGELFGVSGTRIRQIIAKTIRKIKNQMARKKIH
jgi:DNA-directed RNA polymerase sigma subunit (sigma70/sigma32)